MCILIRLNRTNSSIPLRYCGHVMRREEAYVVGKTVMDVPVEEGTEDRSSSDFIISRNEEFSKIAVNNFFTVLK